MIEQRVAIGLTLNFPTNQNGDLGLIKSKEAQRSHKIRKVAGAYIPSISLPVFYVVRDSVIAIIIDD